MAWLFDDNRSETAHIVMRGVVAEGAIVPSLVRLEVANVLRNAVRRGRGDEAFVDRSLATLVSQSSATSRPTITPGYRHEILARKAYLSLYDAADLELAIRGRVSLPSCDQALLAAAARRTADVFAA